MRIKLQIILLAASTVFLPYGWIQRDPKFSVTGACLYLTALCINLMYLGLTSKKFKEGKPTTPADVTIFARIAKWLEGIIVVAALIVFVIGDEYTAVSVGIIWFGSVAAMFLSGIIIDFIADIPMRWTHGGWKVYRPKSKTKRR